MNRDNLVEVKNFVKIFPIRRNGVIKRTVQCVHAVNNVSFDIRKGEAFGLVGESGCGKTTTAQCIMQLQKPTSGSVLFNGKDLTKLSPKAMRKMRKSMQIVFQDPFSSLDPQMTAEDIIGEPLKVFSLVKSGIEYKKRVYDLMNMVELEPYMAVRYPHEFSGGQRQRIGIARAIAAGPSLLICDEPVSALDVSIQAQILNLFIKLRKEQNLTYLFIAHDLAVVRNLCDRVAVMYLGRIVEITSSDELYTKPLHPYTISLLSAVPIPDPVIDRNRERIILSGDVPSPVNLPSGCAFHPRCPRATEICKEQVPQLEKVEDNEHFAACHNILKSTSSIVVRNAYSSKEIIDGLNQHG